MYTKNLYKVQYYLYFQTSTACLGTFLHRYEGETTVQAVIQETHGNREANTYSTYTKQNKKAFKHNTKVSKGKRTREKERHKEEQKKQQEIN